MAWDYANQGKDWPAMATEDNELTYCATGQQSPIDLSSEFTPVRGHRDVYLTSYLGWPHAQRTFESDTIKYMPNVDE